MADRARFPCPVCGLELLKGPMASHVGGDRCVLRLHANRGKHADPATGPRALKLRQDITDLLNKIPEVGGD